MKCVACGFGVGASSMMVGKDKMHTVCDRCGVSFMEAGRRMVVMADVCESVAAALAEPILTPKLIGECAGMLVQAASLVRKFKTGGVDNEDGQGVSDGGSRDGVRGNAGGEGKEGKRPEDRSEKEDEEKRKSVQALIL